MNRRQRALLRQYAGPRSIVIPGPGAIWLLYLLVIAALLKYLI